MVFTDEDNRNTAYNELVSKSGWTACVAKEQLRINSTLMYSIALTKYGIQQKIRPNLSADAQVFAIYCHSNDDIDAYGYTPQATYVGYTYGGLEDEWMGRNSCSDLGNATLTLTCDKWPNHGNQLTDFQQWADRNGQQGYISGWSIFGNGKNQLVCGRGCQNITARLDHVEAFGGAVLWTATGVQSQSYFIIRGYRGYGSGPEEVTRLAGGGETPSGAMRTYSVPVPLGYAAFDVVEIDNAGSWTTSLHAEYGLASGFWDRWVPGRDYPDSAYIVPSRERRSTKLATGVGVRSALSLVGSNPEWVRRFNGGLEQTRRRARASKYPEMWRELEVGGRRRSGTSEIGGHAPVDDEFLADAILWAYDGWMIADMAAHLEGFMTPAGDPLRVRWFWGDPDLEAAHFAVGLVLQANAAYQGERTYPARPPLWFVGEAGWTTWDETVCGTCEVGQSACYEYRRFYPGVGRKPVIVVPFDTEDVAQRLITSTEFWNAGWDVDPDGRVVCFVGEHRFEEPSWFMRDMFSNFGEAFSTVGRPVDCYFVSDYDDSTVAGLANVAYDAVNAGAQYVFECALGHNPSLWSAFLSDIARVSNFTTLQRTFWIIPCCGSTGFQLSQFWPHHGKDLLSNPLSKTTAVGVLGQMNGAFEQLHKLYLQYVMREMVTSSGDTVPVPWWSIAEDAAQAMLEDHGEEPDVRDYIDGVVLYAANPMLEPGTILVSPYAEAEIASYVRKCGDDTLHAWSDTTAVGCPQGDRDHIVISVAIDERDVVGPVPPDKITIGQPCDSNIVFYGPLVADSAATLSEGFYRTTITVEGFGADSCGVDSSVVRLYNIDLGYARFDVKSFDVQTSGATRGIVGLPDLATFANHFPSSVCNCLSNYMPYWSCVDWAPVDTVVNLGDLSAFSPHWQHSYPDSGPSLALTVGTASGTVALGFEEDSPLIGPRTLRASVRLNDVDPFRVMFLSFKNENPVFRFHGWQQGANFRGRTGCVDVVRNGQKEIVVVAVGPKEQEARVVELGCFELEILSREPLQLTEDDFSLQAADILSLGGRALAMGGSQLERTAEPVVYRNELAQNYPNPFNPATTIAFSIAGDSHVELVIFDVTGARVRTLVDELRRANNYREVWDGRSDKGSEVASGVYFYRLTAGTFTDTKKM